jgi:hypothetical protein
MMTREGIVGGAVALLLACSSARAATDAALDAMIAQYAKGYDKDRSVSGDLAKFAPIDIKLAKGECVVAVFRIAEGGKLGPAARQYLSFDFHSPEAEISAGPGMGRSKVGAVSAGGCAFKAAHWQFDISTTRGAHSLGTGGYTVEIYLRHASDAELKREAAITQAATAEDEREARDMTRGRCRRCEEDLEDCLKGRRQPYSESCFGDHRRCSAENGCGR